MILLMPGTNRGKSAQPESQERESEWGRGGRTADEEGETDDGANRALTGKKSGPGRTRAK